MEGHLTMPILELDDIQSGVLRPRPTPFAATYIVLRIDDRSAGRELMRRLSKVVASAAHPESPARDTWISVALSFQGLKALGVPQVSLDSFSPQFQQGMAARAKTLGDQGESSPENWEKPLGSPDVHVVLTAISPDSEHLESALERARKVFRTKHDLAVRTEGVRPGYEVRVDEVRAHHPAREMALLVHSDRPVHPVVYDEHDNRQLFLDRRC